MHVVNFTNVGTLPVLLKMPLALRADAGTFPFPFVIFFMHVVHGANVGALPVFQLFAALGTNSGTADLPQEKQKQKDGENP